MLPHPGTHTCAQGAHGMGTHAHAHRQIHSSHYRQSDVKENGAADLGVSLLVMNKKNG